MIDEYAVAKCGRPKGWVIDDATKQNTYDDEDDPKDWTVAKCVNKFIFRCLVPLALSLSFSFHSFV